MGALLGSHVGYPEVTLTDLASLIGEPCLKNYSCWNLVEDFSLIAVFSPSPSHCQDVLSAADSPIFNDRENGDNQPSGCVYLAFKLPVRACMPRPVL